MHRSIRTIQRLSFNEQIYVMCNACIVCKKKKKLRQKQSFFSTGTDDTADRTVLQVGVVEAVCAFDDGIEVEG